MRIFQFTDILPNWTTNLEYDVHEFLLSLLDHIKNEIMKLVYFKHVYVRSLF